MKIKTLFTICLLLVINFNTFSQHTVNVKVGENTFTVSGDTTKNNFKATIAKLEKRFSDAAKYKIKAIESGEITTLNTAYYEIACFYAEDKNYEKSASYLNQSIDKGWSDLAHLEYDKDLESLRKTNHWEKIKPRINDYYKTNSKEIAKLYAEDQSARLSGKKNENLPKEDSIRRVSVRKLIKYKKINSADDYYKAAMIIHHGTSEKDYKQAHKLALKAYKKKNRHHMSPWLVAATKDRYLLKKGKKQWYGTQDLKFIDGKLALDPSKINIKAASDKKRAKYNAPSIEKLKEYISAFSSK